ncbi:hypothetical protein [Sandaracinus amylolyticus]|uniref:hypothetical protein n=1 Tax=Sandaracinus amylolyticus TaxID=927083 RepID=UPI001F401507|nr:hypothetical protein [Sandaracinus amylolyticus]UJR85816.1 Hypothetical protein I5071_78960 [Sandaracinus amylolyticus]
MNRKHTIVWVDHHEAHVVQLHAEGADYEASRVRGLGGQTHDKRHDSGHRHVLDTLFADRIAQALEDSEEILVCGPSTAKDELMARLRDHHPAIAKRVIAVEPMDHPTEAQLADHARRAFRIADRMRGVHVR